jgi:phosphoadenosine phosphosulfate reductase
MERKVADADRSFEYRTAVPLHAVPALDAIEGKTIIGRLSSIVEALDGRIVLTTSFGMQGQLIAHHVFTAKLPVEVVTLDTGRHFPETYEVWQQTEERYGVRIRAFYPEGEALSHLIDDQGINGFYRSKDARQACCDARKVQPLRHALAGASGWIVGLRADQSRHRASVKFANWEPQHRLMKFAPLFDWTRDEVAAECEALGVPVSALHDRGYPSIGCQPCTRAVLSGEDERAGRWWWENDRTKECGLHLDASGRPMRTKAA